MTSYATQVALAKIYGARFSVTYREYAQARNQIKKSLEGESSSSSSEIKKSPPRQERNSEKGASAPSQVSKQEIALATPVYVVVRSLSEYEALEQKDVVAVFSSLPSAKQYAEKEKLERGEELEVFEMPVDTVPKKTKRVFDRRFVSSHHTSMKKRKTDDDEEEAPNKKNRLIDLAASSEEEESANDEEEESADLIEAIENDHEDANADDDEDSEDRAFINDDEVEFESGSDGLPDEHSGATDQSSDE